MDFSTKATSIVNNHIVSIVTSFSKEEDSYQFT